MQPTSYNLLRRSVVVAALLLSGLATGSATAEEAPNPFAHGLGEVVRIQADGGFFALRQLPPSTRGWIILLQDAGVPPYASGWMQQLHDTLPDRGWATLTIEMPGTADSADAWVSAARQRLSATIVWLQQRNEYAIVAAGQGLSGVAALQHAARPTHGLRGIILIDVDAPLHAPSGQQGRRATFHALSQTRLPLLDLYHDAGQTAVQTAAEERHKAIRRGGHADYSPLGLTTSVGSEPTPFSLRRVHGWLERHADHIAAGQPDRRRR